MKEYKYKGFTLIRNGYIKTPWNIYRSSDMKWISFGRTMKECKNHIDDNCYVEEMKSKY